MSELERLFLTLIQEAGLPEPETQYQFNPSRRWKADFSWPEYRIIAEVQGMTHVASRGHTSHSGIHRDYEKQNDAQLLGYRYFEFDRDMIESGMAVNVIARAMNQHTANK